MCNSSVSSQVPKKFLLERIERIAVYRLNNDKNNNYSHDFISTIDNEVTYAFT